MRIFRSLPFASIQRSALDEMGNLGMFGDGGVGWSVAVLGSSDLLLEITKI